MICVGVDSACKTASVEILRDGKLLYEESRSAGLTHSETLLPMIAGAMAAAGVTPAEVDLYAVTAGPGSFTGLRIGLAAVKGLAQPRQTPCVGVSTLEALSWNVVGEGTVIAALDARRGEVYWAAFDALTHTRITEDTASSLEKIDNLLKISKKPVFFVGDGADLCYNRYNLYSGVERLPSALVHPRAAGVCLSAVIHGAEAVSPALLLPNYLRLSQAERERAAKLVPAE